MSQDGIGQSCDGPGNTPMMNADKEMVNTYGTDKQTWPMHITSIRHCIADYLPNCACRSTMATNRAWFATITTSSSPLVPDALPQWRCCCDCEHCEAYDDWWFQMHKLVCTIQHHGRYCKCRHDEWLVT